MKLTKFLNVLDDLNREEQTREIDKKLQDLVNVFNQMSNNQNNANLSKKLETSLEKVLHEFDNSIIDSFSISDFKIAQEIQVVDYFGQLGMQKIENIIEKDAYNPAKISEELSQFKTQRLNRIKTIKSIQDNLQELGFKPYYRIDNIYEVGLLFSSLATDNQEIPIIARKLNKWNNILKTINEILGNSPENAKIKYVSDGSVNFFIEQGPEVAGFLALTVERLVALYKKILEIRELRLKMKKLKFPEEENEIAKKHEKQTIEEELETIKKELLENFLNKKVQKERSNELNGFLENHLKYLARSVDEGEHFEILTPVVEKPEEPNEEASEEDKKSYAMKKSNYERLIKQVELAENASQMMKELVGLNNDVFKYLNSGENNEEE